MGKQKRHGQKRKRQQIDLGALSKKDRKIYRTEKRSGTQNHA